MRTNPASLPSEGNRGRRILTGNRPGRTPVEQRARKQAPSMSRSSSSSPAPPLPEGASAKQLARPPSGIQICYQTFGDASADPLLLVMGLGGPMTWWDPDFCRMLADAGFFVVRYDNRDTGRSSRVRGRVTRRMLAQSFMGRRTRA